MRFRFLIPKISKFALNFSIIGFPSTTKFVIRRDCAKVLLFQLWDSANTLASPFLLLFAVVVGGCTRGEKDVLQFHTRGNEVCTSVHDDVRCTRVHGAYPSETWTLSPLGLWRTQRTRTLGISMCRIRDMCKRYLF